MSNIINKAENAMPGHHNNPSSAPEGTHGPHHSRVANAADPRVDSDRDNRAAPTGTKGDYPQSGAGAFSTGGLGSTGGHHSGEHHTGEHHSGTAEGTHGPHHSRVANAADPRVDSDQDASRTIGNTGSHATTGSHFGGATGAEALGGHHGTQGAGTMGHHGTTGTEGLTGHHASTGTGTGHHGTQGLGSQGLGTTGHHGTTGAENLTSHHASTGTGTGTGTGHHGTTGHGTQGTTGSHGTSHHGASELGGTKPGPAPNTAGPHKHDILNKMDPRVDSNLDGSKTVGGDKTFGN